MPRRDRNPFGIHGRRALHGLPGTAKGGIRDRYERRHLLRSPIATRGFRDDGRVDRLALHCARGDGERKAGS